MDVENTERLVECKQRWRGRMVAAEDPGPVIGLGWLATEQAWAGRVGS